MRQTISLKSKQLSLQEYLGHVAIIGQSERVSSTERTDKSPTKGKAPHTGMVTLCGTFSWLKNQAGFKVSVAAAFATSRSATFGTKVTAIQARSQSVTAQEIQIKAVGQGMTARTVTAWPQHG